jgi:ribosomal protein S18 acetylase RimI-like enzyme
MDLKSKFFKISKIEKEDVSDVEQFIEYFFPYTPITKEKIVEKLKMDNFFLIKHHQKNIITGFAEVEFFFDKKEARLNAIFVGEAWRGQRIATKLMKKCIHEVKRKKHIHRLFLLVKESNLAAKNLYRKSGFEFESIHDKIIDGCVVEVWAMYVH